MKRNKDSKSFTLIEILVVILLILMLAGIAIPRLSRSSDENKKSKAQVELKIIQDAIESYLSKSSRELPPATIGNLTDLGSAFEAVTVKLVGRLEDLIDPFTSTSQYKYKTDTSRRYYVIYSVGPDRIANVISISVAGKISPPPTTIDDILATNAE